MPRSWTPQASDPPELAAATEQPLELTGGTHSVELTVPVSTRSLLAGADVTAGARTRYLNVEDIEAERNPGIVCGVFLNLPPDDPATRRQIAPGITLATSRCSVSRR